MLTTEEWTSGPGAHPAIKGLVWCRDGPKELGAEAEVYGQSLGNKYCKFSVVYSNNIKLDLCHIYFGITANTSYRSVSAITDIPNQCS